MPCRSILLPLHFQKGMVMLMKTSMPRLVKNTLIILAIFCGAFAVINLICYIGAGRPLFNTILDVRNFLRTSSINFCIALALSFNLTNGRFDLSLGAQRMVATVIGGNIALQLGLGSFGIVVFAILVGILAGALVGVVYVTFRIPPMVLGIGMALVYECVAFAFSPSGLILYGVDSIQSLFGIGYPLATVVVFSVIFFVMLRYTKFGYRTRAIQGSQRLSRNAGINVSGNAVLCYTLGGGVVAVSGIYDAALKGRFESLLGFSSCTPIWSSCFPMFLGTYLAKWTNLPLGILIATIIVNFLKTGLSVLQFSTNAQSAIELSAFLLFLVIRSNEGLFRQIKQRKARIDLAMQEKMGQQSA